MIAQVIGRIVKKTENSILVETDSGLVFEIFCPLSTLNRVSTGDIKVQIHTHLYIREDQMTLFGFIDEAELTLFKHLISVSDIGPKKAINILSNESFQTIVNAIATSDTKFLSTIPGIGKKTAEKIVLDLKDKLAEISTKTEKKEGLIDKTLQNELFSALINLGYKPNQAEKAIANLKNVSNNDFNALFKEALNIIKSL